MLSRNPYLKFLVPLVALLLVNFIYFYPALQGKVLEQYDIKFGYAKGKELREYRAANGEEALWTQSMFSGMPAFQISTQYPNNWLSYVQDVLVFIGGKSSNIYIIFSLMLGFYILMTGLKVNPWLAAIGAFAFAYSFFFIDSFAAGHNAKVRTAAYMAPIILSVILTYRGKYLTGFALTALFVGLSVNSNHFQVTYYLALLLVILALVELFFAYREKTMANFIKASGILVIAAFIGIGPNFSNLWSTYSYTKETMRGGTSELSAKEASKGGLEFDYAMNWSYGMTETLNFIYPNFTGGGSSSKYTKTDTYAQYSPLIRGNEDQKKAQIGQWFYWGDRGNAEYYVGAILVFFFILGLFIVQGRIKWWVIIGSLFSLMLGWGRNMSGFNEFLFEYLPVFNKFRVPSMAFVLIFMLIPFFAFFTANKFFNKDFDPKLIKAQLLRTLYITGGLSLIFLLMGGVLFSFSSEIDANLKESGIDLAQLESDRIGLMRTAVLRALMLFGLSFGVCWFYLKEKLKMNMAIIIIGLGVFIDIWSYDRYKLNADSFSTANNYEQAFAATPADRQILADPDIHYRVWNTTANITSDSYTSFWHKSIGGYHGAKLIRYQDLIENQLAKQNLSCFNMLNAKYFILANNGQPTAQYNANACGAAWFVSDIKKVASADEEMSAMDKFIPQTTAIVHQEFDSYMEGMKNNIIDSSSTISITSYDPKHLVYKANVSSDELLAIFSEIYYTGADNDWKTYLDGEEVSHIRANYLLRAMRVPKGEHTIEFKFEPYTYYTGEKVSLAFSILLLVTLGASFYPVIRK